MIHGIAYFLPPKGATEILSFNISSKAWGASIPIPASSGVLSMLDGASFTAVPAAVPGIHDFLVVSGGNRTLTQP